MNTSDLIVPGDEWFLQVVRWYSMLKRIIVVHVHACTVSATPFLILSSTTERGTKNRAQNTTLDQEETRPEKTESVYESDKGDNEGKEPNVT